MADLTKKREAEIRDLICYGVPSNRKFPVSVALAALNDTISALDLACQRIAEFDAANSELAKRHGAAIRRIAELEAAMPPATQSDEECAQRLEEIGDEDHMSYCACHICRSNRSSYISAYVASRIAAAMPRATQSDEQCARLVLEVCQAILLDPDNVYEKWSKDDAIQIIAARVAEAVGPWKETVQRFVDVQDTFPECEPVIDLVSDARTLLQKGGGT